MSTGRNQRFFIKLRSDDYSFVAKRLQNAFGGTSSVPLPAVANECACCSAATERLQAIRVAAYRGQVDKPLDVPVCEHCASHVSPRLSGRELALALAGGVLTVGVVVGFAGSSRWLEIGCLAALALLAAFVSLRGGRSSAGGHCPGLVVTAQPYTLTVITRNRQFAKTLLDLNPSAVLDHPHERFLYEPSTTASER